MAKFNLKSQPSNTERMFFWTPDEFNLNLFNAKENIKCIFRSDTISWASSFCTINTPNKRVEIDMKDN